MPSLPALGVGVVISSGFLCALSHHHGHVILFLVLAHLVSDMINPQHPPQHCRTTEVVDCEIRAALIFVLEKCEAPTLACFFVADQINMDGFAELRKNCHDVALREVIRKTSDVDPGGIAVVGMP